MSDGFRNDYGFDAPFAPRTDYLGYGNVNVSATQNVIEDAFVDAEISAGGSGTQGDYVGLAVGPKALRIFFSALAAVLVLVLTRAAQVQIARNDYYVRQAEGNRSRVVWVPSERGVMYDRNGIALVRNIPDFSVSVIPADLPTDAEERRKTIARLAEVTGVTAEDIEKKIAEFAKYPTAAVTVSDTLTHTQAVLASIESARLPGVSLVTGMRREYLTTADAPSLSHVIGYQGRITQADLDAGGSSLIPSDFVGKTGLERTYEETLRGSYGKRRIEVDALGRQKKVIAEENGSPGRNIVLAIDLDLQKASEKALQDALKSSGKTRGSVVVMHPKTGEILALVSEPAFDNNLFAKGISTEDYRTLAENEDHPLFPRAVSASLPSGSTFKMVVGAAAIQEKIVSPTSSFLSSGGLRIGEWFFPDWKAGGHGPTDLTRALAESVNTYFYIIGGGLDDFTGLGVARIADYARKFGFGAALGIDLPGEGAGFIPSKEWKESTKGERWYVGDTYHLAIGQGDLLVTPLQIASATAVIANGGDLVRPRVVNAITADDGTRVIKETEVISAQVVGKDAVNAVRRGMRAAVTQGSARSLGGLPVAVAAKTGTAQWHSAKKPHAWFTSFAPYDDPEIVVTVAIEEGGEGSAVAAPVARAIYESRYRR
jgi:penicillin-binding protein 2